MNSGVSPLLWSIVLLILCIKLLLLSILAVVIFCNSSVSILLIWLYQLSRRDVINLTVFVPCNVPSYPTFIIFSCVLILSLVRVFSLQFFSRHIIFWTHLFLPWLLSRLLTRESVFHCDWQRLTTLKLNAKELKYDSLHMNNNANWPHVLVSGAVNEWQVK